MTRFGFEEYNPNGRNRERFETQADFDARCSREAGKQTLIDAIRAKRVTADERTEKLRGDYLDEQRLDDGMMEPCKQTKCKGRVHLIDCIHCLCDGEER